MEEQRQRGMRCGCTQDARCCKHAGTKDQRLAGITRPVKRKPSTYLPIADSDLGYYGPSTIPLFFRLQVFY